MKRCEVCEGTQVVMYQLVKGCLKIGPCPCCNKPVEDDGHPGAR